MERAAEIEEIFLQNVVFLETEAQNTESLNPYAPLADFEFLQLMKIGDKVSEAYQERINHLNRNLSSAKTKQLVEQAVSLNRHLVTLTVIILFCITYVV